MAECIERDLATKAIYELCCREELGSEGESALYKALAAVEKIPAADVRPERHGEWLFIDDGFYECSKCGAFNDRVAGQMYCWKCGAKMDGKDGENNVNL